jgi:chemotaxis protein methyltransferase CheR
MATTFTNADVSAEQLDRYARLIYQRIGIAISPQKTTLLSNRLRRRLRATGLDSYDRYYDLLKRSPASDPEWDAFLQEVTTHETYLFRDQAHWEWLRVEFARDVAAEAAAGKREKALRVWSAACSTGDEAYTIGCCLADRLQGWKLDILGTDVGAGAVAEAERAHFGPRAMKHVPPLYRQRYFERAADGQHWSARPCLKEIMRFKVHNLLEPLGERPFDLIVLKNVLIYFDAGSKQRVLGNVRRLLRPGSVLITGPAEGVSDMLKDMQSTQGWLHRVVK